ncbi:hypothetical protein WJX84_000970 [Apatococcus fuscideae]|uniref:Uncharacterized protein n=1 Tax=Apatococcus fuscideae TaxID=2026836 RepID=A0AAW1T9B7_9CHLO
MLQMPLDVLAVPATAHPSLTAWTVSSLQRPAGNRAELRRPRLSQASYLYSCRLHPTQATKDSGPMATPDPGTDLAVFQFTLGIPGFDDALIPRIIGCAVNVLLVANHLAASNPAPAQWRTEVVGAVLGLVGVAAPSVDRLLKDKLPGRGRTKSVSSAATMPLLALSPRLRQDVRQEVAWGTYSLVCNVNCSSVLIVDGNNEIIGARGSFGQSPLLSKQPDANLQLFTKIWKQMQSLQGSRGSSQSEQAQQLSDACQKLPADLRSILTANSARDVRVCRARDGTSRVAVLVVAEPTARLSQSEVKWASMIAQKMEGCLQMQPAQS